MAGKLPKSKRVKRSHYTTDEEFIKALVAQGRTAEAEAYAARKGLE